MRPTFRTREAMLALGLAAGLAGADESNFKAYGFADVQLTSMWYSESNFLRLYGIVPSHAQLNLYHLNTYFDWKPNPNVRMLAEVSYNRDPYQTTMPGRLVRFDSAAVYGSLYSQVGSATKAGMLAFLQTTPYAALPAPVLSHVADSLVQDTLSKTVHQIGDGVRSKVAEDRKNDPKNPLKVGKDHGIALPRVHADISVSDELNFRVGKFVTPAGIWNVDHGSPAILTVRQPYQTSFFPIFPESQTGAQVFGKTVAMDQDLSYAGWVSTGRGGMDVLGRYDYGQDPKNLDDWAVGSHLQADLGVLDGIRLGGTFQTGTMREEEEWATVPVNTFDLATQVPSPNLAMMTVRTDEKQYSRELCYGLDTKLSWKKILLQAEWNHRKVLNLMADRKATDFNAWYVLVSRNFPITKNFEVAPYAMHESIGWTDAKNNPALELGAVPMEGFQTWMGGLNFGIYSNVRLKLEYSRIEIEKVNLAVGDLANTYTDSDLAFDDFEAQLSVAF